MSTLKYNITVKSNECLKPPVTQLSFPAYNKEKINVLYTYGVCE